MNPAVRRDQLGEPSEDFVDPALPAGRIVVPKGTDWTVVAAITGPAGIHGGSYHQVCDESQTGYYTVQGVDTRQWMVRQIWGARVLQSGTELPDCEIGGGWTFSLLPGEGLVKGQAVSGTILYNKVRFRLGKPTRGAAVVRICPALPVET